MPRTRGKFSVKQLPHRIRSTSDGRSYIIPYVGPYAQLLTMEPAIDSLMPGFGDLYRVSEVVIERGKSLEGSMDVTITLPRRDKDNTGDDAQIGDPLYELDWSEERRPIEEHRKCGRLKANRPYYKYPSKAFHETNNKRYYGDDGKKSPDGPFERRTWDDWASLDDEDYDKTGEWSLSDYLSLKEGSTNDYPIAFPVARVTIYSRYRKVPNGNVWSVSTPPGACNAPGGWTYVKTSSRSTKQARLYTLVEEWRGYNAKEARIFN